MLFRCVSFRLDRLPVHGADQPGQLACRPRSRLQDGRDVEASARAALQVLPMLGLAIEFGIIANTQRKLEMTVDAAAHIGAMQLNQTASHTGGVVQVDSLQAETIAEDYLAESPGVQGLATADADQVEVVAQRAAAAPFHTLLKLPTPVLRAPSKAAPCAGIIAGEASC